MNLFDLIDKPPKSVLGEPLLNADADLGAQKSTARLILAGGRGSRLGLGPKALIEVAGQKLIDYFLESKVETFVMCAQESLDAIQSAAPGAFCFAQEELALLDERGSVCGFAPCGNGDAFAALGRAGLLEQITADRLVVYPIDNPLGLRAEPLLARGIGDVLIAAVPSIQNELAGGLVEVEGKVRVVEYLHAKDQPHWINTGIYSLDMNFVRGVFKEPLPIHPVQKEGLWKFEKFLFDAFAYARESQALGFEREEIFCPIKCPADLDKFASAHQSVTIE